MFYQINTLEKALPHLRVSLQLDAMPKQIVKIIKNKEIWDNTAQAELTFDAICNCDGFREGDSAAFGTTFAAIPSVWVQFQQAEVELITWRPNK